LVSGAAGSLLCIHGVPALENETEASLFSHELYEQFKINPEVRQLFIIKPSLTDDMDRPDGTPDHARQGLDAE